MKKSNVAVVGCGIFGAMTAIRLAESGLKVTIYDRPSDGVDKGLLSIIKIVFIWGFTTQEMMKQQRNVSKVLKLLKVSSQNVF